MLLQHIEELQADLRGLAAHETALRGLADAVMNSCNTGGKLLTCGNGGSATAAQQAFGGFMVAHIGRRN